MVEALEREEGHDCKLGRGEKMSLIVAF
jgi:hypothetical protein